MIVVLALLTRFAAADDYEVTTTADHGPGSLRFVIEQVNNNPGDPRPRIAIPVCGVIALQSALPPILAPNTYLGYPSRAFLDRKCRDDRPAIDGRLAGDATGIVVRADNFRIFGMAVYGFARHGIEVHGNGAIIDMVDVGLEKYPDGIVRNGGDALLLDGTPAEVGNCYLVASRWGIHVTRSDSFPPRNSFAGNVVRNNAAGGAWIERGAKMRLESGPDWFGGDPHYLAANTAFFDNGGPGIVVDSDDATLAFLQSVTNWGSGVIINGRRAQISNVVIAGNGAWGVIMNGSAELRGSFVDLTQNLGGAMLVYDVPSAHVVEATATVNALDDLRAAGVISGVPDRDYTVAIWEDASLTREDFKRLGGSVVHTDSTGRAAFAIDRLYYRGKGTPRITLTDLVAHSTGSFAKVTITSPVVPRRRRAG
jgi:hypothetical protein